MPKKERLLTIEIETEERREKKKSCALSQDNKGSFMYYNYAII